MPPLILSLPLSTDDRQRAIVAMATGRATSVRIGQCSLHVDRSASLVWGVDAYGQDRIAAGDAAGLDLFEHAVAWAVAEHGRPPGDHPAERNVDF